MSDVDPVSSVITAFICSCNVTQCDVTVSYIVIVCNVTRSAVKVADVVPILFYAIA